MIEIGALVDGRYRVEAEIGRGAYGIVYRANDETSGAVVALKVLRSEYLSVDRVRGRVLREAEILRTFDHPNIARAYAAIAEEDQVILVLDLLTGETLQSAMRARAEAQRPLSVEEISNLAVMLARGLTYAHARGIIHRDLKPANVVLNPRPVIVDFGLAGFLEASAADQMTTLGRILGTPLYMPPEQAEGRPADVRNDYFALATMLYEAATLCYGWAEDENGRPLTLASAFQGRLRVTNSPARVLLRIASRERRLSLATTRPDLPPRLIAWIEAAGAISPDARPSSLSELLDADFGDDDTMKGATSGPAATLPDGGILFDDADETAHISPAQSDSMPPTDDLRPPSGFDAPLPTVRLPSTARTPSTPRPAVVRSASTAAESDQGSRPAKPIRIPDAATSPTASAVIGGAQRPLPPRAPRGWARRARDRVHRPPADARQRPREHPVRSSARGNDGPARRLGHGAARRREVLARLLRRRMRAR